MLQSKISQFRYFKMFANTKYSPDGFNISQYQTDLKQFSDEYTNKSIHFYDPNYEGHMLWDVSKPHLDVLNIAQAQNQNSVDEECSPYASELEKKFISELASDIGYPKKSWGYISSGGTISNLAALWVGRNKLRSKGREAKYVLIADDHHYSIEKACDILGLEIKSLEENINVSPKQIAAVVCICGTTECGRVDDILRWRKFCDEHDIHLHADAAYGGYYIYCKDSEYLTDDEKKCLENLKLADSITIDPHKVGYAPYPAGVFLLKNEQDVMFINPTHNVKYLGVMSTSLYTIEGSRSGAIAASCYFGHHQLRPHYHSILEANLIGSKKLIEKIQQSKEFELYKVHGMAQVCFTSKNLPMNYLMKVFCDIKNLSKSRIQLVTTNLDGKYYFRICVMNPTFKDHIDEWWSKFNIEFEDYKKKFEIYVKERTEKIMSISISKSSEEAIRDLIKTGKKIVAYNGFEPSGRLHIAQAVITVLNTKLLLENGCRVIIYMGDLFAKLNLKLGGDMDKIRTVGMYIIEVFKSLGIRNVQDKTVDPSDLHFIWASELIDSDPNYWGRVLDISMRTRDQTAKSCIEIMGMKPGEKLYVSQFLYPCMQVADIFEMDVDIAQLGEDQKSGIGLAQEYARSINNSTSQKLKIPVSLEHHLILGLDGTQKMSKSDPKNAIFVDDEPDEIKQKVLDAVCNDKIDGNPIFEYIKFLIFPWFGSFEFDGNVYDSVDGVVNDFIKFDKRKLKETVADYFIRILEPVKKHFIEHELKDLKEQVLSYKSLAINRIPTESPGLFLKEGEQIDQNKT